MAASSIKEPETLNPSDLKLQTSMEAHNSETTITGEKRKRIDSESETPDPSLNPLWKTSLCSYFRSDSGSCSHGITCRYAHGEEELRKRPDNSWDPTSEMAKKVKMETDSAKKEDEEKVMMTELIMDDEGIDNVNLSKCLIHLPKRWDSEKLRDFLSQEGILFQSAKKKYGMSVGFVNFESNEQLNKAIEDLDGKTIGKNNLKVADVIPRSFEKTIKSAMDRAKTSESLDSTSLSSNDAEDADTIDEDSTLDDEVSKGRSAREAVTPLAHMSYSDQLDHKKSSLVQALKKLPRNARKACPKGVSLPEWVLKARDIGGLPCNFGGILESPIVNGYRNKCEFSVGYSLENKPTVGFMLGNFREGVTAVEEPIDCPNVSRISRKYASIFQDFLQLSSLPIWNRFKNVGFWRQLTVREGRSPGKLVDLDNSDANICEVMLIVQVSSLGVQHELKTSEFKRLAQAFAGGAVANSPPLPLTAIIIQHHQGISNVAPANSQLQPLPIPNVHGAELEATNDVVEVEPRIHDYISNLKFCISPTAFFQVNTLAAEKLYSLAGDWAELGPDTLLFDICCGTGTIGLTLAHRVGMVLGIEMNSSAVSDARRNAEINGIKNCKFVCAKAEDVMGSLLKEYLNVTKKQDEIVSADHRSEGIPNASDKSDDIANASEKNDKDPAAGETNSLMDNVQQDPVVSHVLQNDANALDTSEVCSQENGSQLQSYNAKNGTDLMMEFKNVVAIVDPPRAGLHPIVTRALRTHTRLRRLVYISCNPESLVANAIELCTPSSEKTEKGNRNHRGWRKENVTSASLARQRVKSMPDSEPFRPVKAMAVDLFPHTPHCEMVMLLER